MNEWLAEHQLAHQSTKQQWHCFIITPDQTLARGLQLLGFPKRHYKGGSRKVRLRHFKAHYGSKPIVLSVIWDDLQATTLPEARVNVKRFRDVDYFFMAMYYAKCYPTEERMMSVFHSSEKTIRHWCWYYLKKIAALKTQKIVWPEEWSDEDTELDLPVVLCTVDGNHCRILEPYHPLYCKDIHHTTPTNPRKLAWIMKLLFQFMKIELFGSEAPFQLPIMTWQFSRKVSRRRFLQIKEPLVIGPMQIPE